MRNLIIFLLLIFIVNGCGRDYSSPEIKDVVNRNGNTVVLVNTDNSLGSGVIITEDGKIITNYHVIENADIANVKLKDGRRLTVKGVIKSDPAKDLAIIKIDGRNLNVPIIGTISSVNVGDEIVAIGNPKGLENTVTEGIVSGLNREIDGMKMIQISAPISSGSSGGGVFNLNGELIGISTSKIMDADAEGLSFAVPIDELNKFIMNKELSRKFDENDSLISETNINNSVSGVKRNPFFHFLTNILTRILFFCIIMLIAWLLCLLFYRQVIIRGGSPISAYSTWALVWLIIFVLFGFLVFSDLSYTNNVSAMESFGRINFLVWIILGIILISIFAYMIILRKQKYT